MSAKVKIKRRILESLTYPRQIAKANVDLSACPHSGLFQASDDTCRKCIKNYECDWLNSTDEFNDLAAKPMKFLYRALTFGIDYVDARNVVSNHHEKDCGFENCEWLEDARDIAHEYTEMTA